MRYDLHKFGINFKKTRIDNNLSIQQLSMVSGISERTIMNIEKNKSEPRIETLQILSFHLKVDLLELLLECKSSLEFQFYELVNSFHRDLKSCQYKNTTRYLEAFNQIKDQIDKQKTPNTMPFQHKVQTAIYWVKGVMSSTLDQDIEQAENYFLSALTLRNKAFDLNNLNDYFLSNLSLHVLNSLAVNRLRHNKTELCESIMLYIIHMFENKILMESQLYISSLYNLANLYLEEDNHSQVIVICKKYFEYSKKSSIQYLAESFLLLYEVSNYLSLDCRSVEKIEYALSLYLNSDKSHLVPIIKENLEKKYDINIR